MATRTQVRPRLVLDLSEQVSNDLKIGNDLQSTTAPMPSAPSMKSAPVMSAVPVMKPRVVLAATPKMRAWHAIREHKPPAGLVQMLRQKIRTVLPDDGNVVYTITHDFGGFFVGSKWENYNECNFWLGSENQLDYAIDEWMNGEYEWVCDSLYNPDTEDIKHPVHDHYRMAPEVETLLQAWDAVAYGHEGAAFMVPVLNRAGIVVEQELVDAEEIVGWFGIERATIIPTVVIADRLLPQDLIDIENDEEVLLDGYIVKEADLSGEVAVFHIEPN